MEIKSCELCKVVVKNIKYGWKTNKWQGDWKAFSYYDRLTEYSLWET